MLTSRGPQSKSFRQLGSAPALMSASTISFTLCRIIAGRGWRSRILMATDAWSDEWDVV